MNRKFSHTDLVIIGVPIAVTALVVFNILTEGFVF